ncbi:MAG: transaldolase family protein [Cardiobacterium sp.]
MYLDSADPAAIARYLPLGILKGITTNPTLLKKQGGAREAQLAAILATRPPLLFVQVLGATTTEMLDDYHRILAAFPDAPLGIKIPVNHAGLETIAAMRAHRLDLPLLGTAIYSAEQAILAGIAGCDFVAPYINRMENHAIDPCAVIATTRRYYDNHAIPCQIMGASFKNSAQILRALDAGAHTCTIPPDLLHAMLEQPLVAAAIQAFNADGAA